jgi:hypothetical protein
MGYGAIEWICSPGSQTGGLDYSGIVRGLIANTSTWPVTGMFPPRLVRAKLRASSLAYWAGGKHMQTAFEISLERTLRMSLDALEVSQQQHERQHLFRFVPSSIFDCRKPPPFRGGGGRNTCVHVSAYCVVAQSNLEAGTVFRLAQGISRSQPQRTWRYCETCLCRITALVTAADSKYLLPLKNFVGSVKFHDNGTRILVYVQPLPR